MYDGTKKKPSPENQRGLEISSPKKSELEALDFENLASFVGAAGWASYVGRDGGTAIRA